MFSGLRISTKLLALIGALLAGMLFVGGYGIHALQGEHQRAAQALQREQQSALAVDAARHAEVAFKIQVQEWKNILLRGHEAADHARYLAAFDRRAALVVKDLEQLERAMQALGVDPAPVADARRMHAELGGSTRRPSGSSRSATWRAPRPWTERCAARTARWTKSSMRSWTRCSNSRPRRARAWPRKRRNRSAPRCS